MADFHQGGSITTLHRLGRSDVERLERELLQHSRARPVALVLPCLFSELGGPALKGIVDGLRGVHYLSEIVVSISGPAARADYEQMRSLFDGVTTLSGQPPVLLWNSGQRVQALLETLREEGLEPGSDGKGAAAVETALRAFVTPRYLAEAARDLAKAHKSVRTRVLEEGEIRKLGMGSFLSVTRGSDEPARLIGPKDALLVVSFRNYTPDVLAIAQDCHKRGVPVVSITDHALSPLALHSRVCFQIDERPTRPFPMLVAPLCLAQALVVAVGEALTEKGGK